MVYDIHHKLLMELYLSKFKMNKIPNWFISCFLMMELVFE